jgi:nicotinamide-nucleotide amidase
MSETVSLRKESHPSKNAIMVAEIITVGDEILIGQTVDTNSAWLGQNLNAIGVEIGRITSIRDTEEAIVSSLEEALDRTSLVLMTGGLGPTKDDLTKQTLARYFQTELVLHPQVLSMIEGYFASTGRQMLEVNRKQAELPANCRVILNRRGTASGMWFEHDGKVVVSMPGVPHEMKGLMEDEILGLIKEKFSGQTITHRTVMTQGIGESYLAEIITDWENQLRSEGLSLAYLPSPGIVKLRITAKGIPNEKATEILNSKVEDLLKLAGEYVYGFDDQTLSQVIGEALRVKKKTMCTAESCTGGIIGASIVSVAGSSDYYNGGVVAYSYDMKADFLDVNRSTIALLGAVSKETAEEMAIGIRVKTRSDFGLATTGIAGPSGGTPDKPVGSVWVAVSSAKGVKSKLFRFKQNRARNIELTMQSALFMLFREIIESDLG